MKQPKVVLKNVKTFEGHDGTGLSADIWINGIKCMHVFDGAFGGDFEYTENLHNNPKAEQVKKNIELLKQYVAFRNGKESFDKMSDIYLDLYIDNVLEKQETEKANKKFEKEKLKLMQTAILLGKPDEKKYKYMNFKRPLSEFPKDKLQTYLNQIVLTHCKKDVQVLNTNLEELGVNVRY